MGVQVDFDYQKWLGIYPEFAAVGPDQAQNFFDQATIFQRNDGTGPVSKAATQLMLLNMLTAHLASLYAPKGTPSGPDTPVGRIASASEGSVSASFDYGGNVGQQMAYFIQTKYGAQWWAATAQYRTARYFSGQLQTGGAFGPGIGVGAGRRPLVF